MSNCLPLAISTSHTFTTSCHDTQISYPKSPMYPVREISTDTPLILPEVTRKYFRFAMLASAATFSNCPEVGPCSASAAVFSEISSICTSMFKPFCLNQRRLGSAAVQRYTFSPSREIVPSSITLPSSSHQQQ